MAPWWLRANEKEAEEEEIEAGSFEEFPDDVLELIASEDEDGAAVNDRPQRATGGDEKSDGDGEDSVGGRRKRRRRRKSKAAPREAAPDAKEETPAEKRAEKKPPVDKRVEKRAEKKPAAKKRAEKKPQKAEPQKAEPQKAEPQKAEPQKAEPQPTSAPPSFEPLSREDVLFDLPERSLAVSDERKIALFCDLENIALGVRDSEIERFDIGLVIERILEKGKIVVKRAYADWERYSDYKRAFHDAAIELIDIPHKRHSGKNSADIKMVVDAMDLCFSKEHLDTFVLLSGDSDFSPLVSKLKENNKYVIGVGVKNSTSHHLIDNCDEFIYYEDVWRDLQSTPRLDHLSKKEAEVFGLLIESILALLRENKSVVWGSMLKQTMQRKRPSFSEGYYGYSAFSELLDDAEKKDIIRLKRDKRSGNYAVIGFGQQKG